MEIKITINNVAYPCRATMGAMLRFKKETGKEITDPSAQNLSDLCAYLYCCVASACAADKVAFDMKLIDFADAINPDELNDLILKMQGEMGGADKGGGDEKKS